MRRNAYPSIDRRFVLDAAASTLSFEVMFLFFFLLFKLGEVSWEFFFFFRSWEEKFIFTFRIFILRFSRFVFLFFFIGRIIRTRGGLINVYYDKGRAII